MILEPQITENASLSPAAMADRIRRLSSKTLAQWLQLYKIESTGSYLVEDLVRVRKEKEQVALWVLRSNVRYSTWQEVWYAFNHLASIEE